MAREPSSRDDIRFMDNFKRLRTQTGMRQADIAEKLKDWGWEYFTQTTLSRLEKGERPLRLGEARALAAVIGRPISEMVAPPENVSALDRLAEVHRAGRNAELELFGALQSVVVARHNLENAIEAARGVDVDELGDDALKRRATGELKAARSTLASLEEAISELSPESLSIMSSIVDDFEDAPEFGGDDGVDPEAS